MSKLDHGASGILASCLENGLRLARKDSQYGTPPLQPLAQRRLYKVLPNMRYVNSCDFEPNFFIFGLYNCRFDAKPHPCYFYKIEIAAVLTTESSFKELVSTLVGRIDDIRKLYSDGWDMGRYGGERLAREEALILALDALTVVAAACYQDSIRPRSMCTVIWRDAFLLEQQLPLFVLEAAMDSIVLDPGLSNSGASSGCCSGRSANSDDDGTLPESASSRPHIGDVVKFYALCTSYPFLRNVQTQIREHFHSPMALLDMQQSLLSYIHTAFIHAQQYSNIHPLLQYAEVNTSPQLTSRLPTACELMQRHGIRFRVGDGGFTGIGFDKKSRVLTLPEITVFSTSKSYLLNLVAQEVAVSWYDEDPCPVSSYILVMGFLINGEEDVKPLVDAQVLHNHLGSHAELAQMWNSLGINLPISLTQEDSKVINAVREACEAYERSSCNTGHQHRCSSIPSLPAAVGVEAYAYVASWA